MSAAAADAAGGEKAPAAPALPAGPVPGRAAIEVKHRGLLTVGVMMATIMQILDTTIANVALPHMQTALGATSDTITWVLTSYIVASAIALPITGWLSDRVGSRQLFLFSVVLFVIASALCGAANSLGEMVLFRIIQGVAAAFMNPLGQTVMLDINPPERHNKAMAVWGMGIMVGPILGPVLGGWLTENYNWRWVFYVNLPVGVICFAMLWLLLPSRPKRKRPLDRFGFALLAIGISALQLLLDRGQGEDWFASPEVWIELIVAVIGLWMFTVHMATGRAPMFERNLWKNRNLVTGIFFLLVIGMVMMAVMALLPPMLQNLYGYPVLDTGILLIPRGVGVVLTMQVAAITQQRGLDSRWLVATGLVLISYSLWDMTHWTLEMGSSTVIVSGFIQGLGLGLTFMPLNALAFATLPPKYRTEGASLLNLSRSIGGSIGISMVTTVLSRSIQTSHADIAANLTPERFDTLDPSLLAGTSVGDAALSYINGIATQQASMVAYLNAFHAMMLTTIAVIPLTFILRRPKAAAKADPSAMGH